MKKVKFNEITQRKKELFLIDRSKKIRRKPRNKQEEKILDILLETRINELFKKGVIKKIDNKKYKLKI